MSAQRANNTSTSKPEQRSQQGTLARRDDRSSIGSLLADPLDILAISPFSLIGRMQDEMNRVFSQAGSGGLSRRDDIAWVPAIEVAERDGNLIVSAELPGLTDQDVTVEINNDVLIIRGEREFEKEDTDGEIRRTERRYGAFYRAIPLPDGAQTDQASAEFRDGVLRITVPVQQAQANTREIPVQSTASAQSSQARTGQQSASKAETPAGQKAETPAGQKAA
jgi:HSP20 family protein